MVVRILFTVFMLSTILLGSTKSVVRLKKDLTTLKNQVQQLSAESLNMKDAVNKIDTSMMHIRIAQKKLHDVTAVKEIKNEINSIKKDLAVLKSSTTKGDIEKLTKKIDYISSLLHTDKEINTIINKGFFEKLKIIQAEYRNAIFGTNSNITYFGIALSLLGIVLSLLFLIGGWMVSANIKKQLDEHKENQTKYLSKEITDIKKQFDEYKENQTKHFSYKIKNNVQKNISTRLNDMKSDINQIAMSELHLATIEIQKIHQYQHRLFYALNKELATNLSRKGANFEKEYRRFNDRYLRIVDLTSLERKKMITAIKELGVPSLNAISWKSILKEYLEYLKEYDSDKKLREAINVLIAKL